MGQCGKNSDGCGRRRRHCQCDRARTRLHLSKYDVVRAPTAGLRAARTSCRLRRAGLCASGSSGCFCAATACGQLQHRPWISLSFASSDLLVTILRTYMVVRRLVSLHPLPRGEGTASNDSCCLTPSTTHITRVDSSTIGGQFSLSRGERAGVRGNQALAYPIGNKTRRSEWPAGFLLATGSVPVLTGFYGRCGQAA